MSYVLCRCMYICRLGDFDVLNLPYPERLRGYRKKILERGMTVEEKKTGQRGRESVAGVRLREAEMHCSATECTKTNH